MSEASFPFLLLQTICFPPWGKASKCPMRCDLHNVRGTRKTPHRSRWGAKPTKVKTFSNISTQKVFLSLVTEFFSHRLLAITIHKMAMCPIFCMYRIYIVDPRSRRRDRIMSRICQKLLEFRLLPSNLLILISLQPSLEKYIGLKRIWDKEIVNGRNKQLPVT